MELTSTEKRVLSIVLVCGRVNRQEFNGACNVDDLHKNARDRALDNLREKGLVPYEALRDDNSYSNDFIVSGPKKRYGQL